MWYRHSAVAAAPRINTAAALDQGWATTVQVRSAYAANKQPQVMANSPTVRRIELR